MYGKIRGRRSRGRRTEKRRLSLESLETRLVLDSQVSMALAGDSAGPDPSALVAFESDQQLRQYLVDAAIARYQELFGKPTWSDWWPYLRADMASVADVSANGLVYGGTNVQETGVDEGDFVKTDGSYLYHVGEQTLTIVDLRDPSNLQITARVPLDQQLWSREIYLAGDRLTIISQRHAMLFAQTDVTNDSLANGLIADWRAPG